MLRRNDGQSAFDYESLSNKKLLVKDTGQAPQFLDQPATEIKVEIGRPFDINIGQVEDPEGAEVYVNVNLRKATMFASFDREEMRITVSSDMMLGEYPITIEYGETFGGVNMPG